VPGQYGNGQRLGQVLERPVAGRRQALAGRRHRALNPLGLAAVPVRGHDQPAGHADGGLAAVIGPDQLHAQVDPGGQPGAGQHLTLIHPQHVRIDLHGRVAFREVAGVLPVGGGPAVVEQARRGQRERTGADRHHPGTAVSRLAQGRADLLAGVDQRQVARHDHGVRGGQRLQAVLGLHAIARRRWHHARRGRADREVIAPGQARIGEDLGRDGQVESLHGGQCDGHHGMHRQNPRRPVPVRPRPARPDRR